MNAKIYKALFNIKRKIDMNIFIAFIQMHITKQGKPNGFIDTSGFATTHVVVSVRHPITY